MKTQNRKVTDHRVQINFPDDLYNQIRRIAYEKRISISEVVRRLVEETVDVSKMGKERSWRKFIEMAGFIKGFPDDSASHDQWAHRTAEFHKQK